MAGSFAVAYSSKNEADLLPDGIAFHRRTGAAKTFLFWDGTTDDGPDRVAGMPDIEARPSLSYAKAIESLSDAGGGWIVAAEGLAESSFDIRKRINFTHAAERAKADGIEWLLCIDADELAIPGPRDPLEPGCLNAMLRRVPYDIDQVLMPNLEAVSTPGDGRSPFRSCRHFLPRIPATHTLAKAATHAARLLRRSPRAQAWAAHWVYRARFGGRYPRPMRHPVTGAAIPRGYFLGYTNHKSLIRTASARRFMHDIHRWKGYAGNPEPKSVRLGNILHYAHPSAELLMSKYRQRPGGPVHPVFHVMHEISKIARDLDDEQVRAFFDTEFVIADPDDLRARERRGAVLRIDAVARVFESIDRADGSNNTPR